MKKHKKVVLNEISLLNDFSFSEREIKIFKKESDMCLGGEVETIVGNECCGFKVYTADKSKIAKYKKDLIDNQIKICQDQIAEYRSMIIDTAIDIRNYEAMKAKVENV